MRKEEGELEWEKLTERVTLDHDLRFRPEDVIAAYLEGRRRSPAEAGLETEEQLRQYVSELEEGVRGQVRRFPTEAIELFKATCDSGESEARLLTAWALDKLAPVAPRVTADLYERLLADEDQRVRERAAGILVHNSLHVIADEIEAPQLRRLLKLAAENFPEDRYGLQPV